jgi:hypothetical protein
MSDEPVRKIHQGEVLPPQEPRSPGLPSLPPGTPLGIPLLARAKYEAHARAFRAYTEFRLAQREHVEVEASLLGAMQGLLAAEERLAKAFQRQRHLDEILLADEATLLAELDGIFEGLAEAQIDRQDDKATKALKKRIERANLEAEALEAEARVERIKNPPPQPHPDATLSRAQRAAQAIARAKEDSAELRAALIKAAGGEDRLTDDDRQHLETLALSLENQIREIMEGL